MYGCVNMHNKYYIHCIYCINIILLLDTCSSVLEDNNVLHSLCTWLVIFKLILNVRKCYSGKLQQNSHSTTWHIQVGTLFNQTYPFIILTERHMKFTTFPSLLYLCTHSFLTTTFFFLPFFLPDYIAFYELLKYATCVCLLISKECFDGKCEWLAPTGRELFKTVILENRTLTH